MYFDVLLLVATFCCRTIFAVSSVLCESTTITRSAKVNACKQRAIFFASSLVATIAVTEIATDYFVTAQLGKKSARRHRPERNPPPQIDALPDPFSNA